MPAYFFTLDQYRGEHVAEINIFGNSMQTLGLVHLDLNECVIISDVTETFKFINYTEPLMDQFWNIDLRNEKIKLKIANWD